MHGAMLALFLYPLLLLTVKGGMGVIFFLLFFLSVAILAKTRNRLPSLGLPDYWFAFAMSSSLFATLLSQAYHANFLFRYWDSPARLMLAIPIYLALKNLGVRIATALETGLPLGAIAGFLVAATNQYFQFGSLASRLSTSYMNPIHFGNLALLLGILSLCSINWTGKDNRYLLALKMLGLFSGVGASIMSGTRGGWIAIPFVMLVWIFFQPNIDKGKMLVRGIGIIACLLVVSYLCIDGVQQRVDQLITEAVSISRGELHTSMGLRLQLWHAATIMFMENPLFGVGPDAFFQKISELQQSGAIPNADSETYGTEVHSYYFALMAELGVFGLAAGFTTFVIPLALFFKASKSAHQFNRIAASMGACTVVSFIIFCVTVEMFNLKMVASFYAVTVAVLMAASRTCTAFGTTTYRRKT